MADLDLHWVVVAGPTASGKSGVALRLAERFGGEIVNADSRQVYRHLDIGTAKPSWQERSRVPHHLFDVVDPDEPFDAALYARQARRAVREVDRGGRVPIVTGGTGLYLRALRSGLFRGPAAVPELRRVLVDLEEGSPGRLHRWLRRLDPEAAGRIHANDTVRIVRALEVGFRSGRPLSEHQREHGFGETLGRCLYVRLVPHRERLDRRIAERSARMFQAGLVEELRRILALGYAPELRPLRSIGYREAERVLRGEWTETEGIEELTKSTRRFARRQEIWFRGEADTVAFDPDEEEDRLSATVREFLGR